LREQSVIFTIVFSPLIDVLDDSLVELKIFDDTTARNRSLWEKRIRGLLFVFPTFSLFLTGALPLLPLARALFLLPKDVPLPLPFELILHLFEIMCEGMTIHHHLRIIEYASELNKGGKRDFFDFVFGAVLDAWNFPVSIE